MLIEKLRHPRFHIGESLLPMNVPIFQRLGVLERVDAMGVRKLGADFPTASERGYNVFRFDRALQPDCPYAYQVPRDAFDAMLFEHAARCGARTLSDTEVRAVQFAEEQVVVSLQGTAGLQSLRARYLIDATGRDCLLGSRLKLPSGWRYEVMKPDADLLLGAKGKATIVQDDLDNTYQKLD